MQEQHLKQPLLLSLERASLKVSVPLAAVGQGVSHTLHGSMIFSSQSLGLMIVSSYMI